MRDPFESAGGWFLSASEIVGQMLRLLVQTLGHCPGAWSARKRIAQQMARVGHESLPIVGAMALFTGMVTALHTGYALRTYGAEEMLAYIVALSIVKEMGPVLTGLLLAGRVGAAIAAEIGTMSVHEEIDALETLGVSPVKYLAVPRFLAAVVMLPTLLIYADVIGIGGGAIVASSHYEITFTTYMKNVRLALDFSDVLEGLTKAAVFGAIIAVVACYFGLRTRGGAAGVGKAITSSVVTSFVCIFVSNYFITRLWI